MGKTVVFAYAMPYSYSDLLKDLNQAKMAIINNLNHGIP